MTGAHATAPRRFAVSRILTLVLAVTPCGSLWSADPAAGTGPRPPAETVATLVRQLGDQHFASREHATRELLRIGLPAVPALEAGARNPDREIRYRSQRLLTLVREKDRRRRLDALTSGRTPPDQLDLPGWPAFRERFGSGQESRHLYAEMLDEEWRLLEAIYGQDPVTADVGRMLATRCHVLRQNRQRGATRGSLMAMFFVAAEFPEAVHPDTNTHLCSFCHRPNVQAALSANSKLTLVRRMIGAWVVASSNDQASAYQRLILALRFDVQEIVPTAEAVLSGPDRALHVKNAAIQVLAKYGGPQHAGILQRLLEDRTPLARNRSGRGTVTFVCDLALAALIHLHDQDVRQFGFPNARETSLNLFDPGSLGFASNEQRLAARQQWREWQQMQRQAATQAEPDEPAQPRP